MASSLYSKQAQSTMNTPLTIFARNREMGCAHLVDKCAILDHRIETLEQSWRHAVPYKNNSAIAGVSAMDFDEAENRFLLCGNTRGALSIVDFESHSNFCQKVESYPKHHIVIQTRKKSHHDFMINQCQWYPVDSSIFATSGMDKILKIWDASQLSSVEQFSFHQPVSNFHWTVSRDYTSSLISVATSSSNVILLDPRTGNSSQQIRCKQQRIWSVRWVRSMKYVLATGSDAGEIALWDVRSAKSELIRVKSPGGISATNNRAQHMKLNSNLYNGVKRPHDFNPKHNKLAHLNRIGCLRCTYDGRFLVSLTQDRNICLWDAETMLLLWRLKIPEPDGDPNSIPVQFELCVGGHHLWAFIPCRNDVIVVKFPTPSKFTINGEPVNTKDSENHIRSLRGHFQTVLACAYRKEINHLVTSSTDRLVLVWAPKMDECRFDSVAQQIHQLHQDAFSDDENL